MKTYFQARVTLDVVTPNDVEMREWTCTLAFYDADGAYSGADIRVGDVLSIDTGLYETGTFSFYTITSIITSDPLSPVVVAVYNDNLDHIFGPPDLSAIFGSYAMVSRPSTHMGLLPVVSTEFQGLSDKFTEYVQNFNFLQIVDKLQQGDRTFLKINGTALPLLKGMAVYIDVNNDTICYSALATSHNTARVAGLLADAVAFPSELGAVSSKGMLEKTTGDWDVLTGGTGGLTAGVDYFLRSDWAGGISSTPPTADGHFVVKLGKAISPTIIDINIEPPIQL
jgi:hypothetical protein